MTSTLHACPYWRAFENMTSGAEAACAAASCAFSLATLEIAWSAEAAGFALTERKEPDLWRWAVVGDGGILLEEGFETSQQKAKAAAAGILEGVRAQKAS
ncbi:MAG TPA: hypothetical protein VGG34_01990 [Opitutaceae bacterium]|jgi:hypothetical protein